MNGFYDKEQSTSIRDLFKDSNEYKKWETKWRIRMSSEGENIEKHFERMCQSNPAVIPRNHRVEQAINAAVDEENYEPFEKLLQVLTNPYFEPLNHPEYMLPPEPQEQVFKTFCGT